MMHRSRSAPFLFSPSSDEICAAESLLLLFDSSSVKDHKMCRSVCRSSSLDSLSIEEESPVHSSISDSVSSLPIGSQIQHDPLMILSIAASLHQIDTMQMQKAAKNLIKKGQAQFSKPKPKPTKSDDLSSDCSAASTITTASAAGRRRLRTAGPARGGPARLWKRGEEIIEFLIGKTACGKAATEAEIRKELGNGPDTSKALRLLVKHAEVKRSGAGGKKNPYLYMPNRH